MERECRSIESGGRNSRFTTNQKHFAGRAMTVTAAYGLVPKAAKVKGVTPVELVQKLLDSAITAAGIAT